MKIIMMIIALGLVASCTTDSTRVSENLEGVAENWLCTKTYGPNVLVKAQVMEDRISGRIYVSGVVHDTVFFVDGFDRRWSWDLGPDGGYRFSFIIEPDGSGIYLDFGDKSEAKPSMVFSCRSSR